ncbi:MAG: preprotein translocase subunit SecB [Methylococcaceae bacterium]|nr:preprotein translocase subunit SecB [Methylococcaceae bacterium]
MISPELQKAIDGLQIQDVYLRSALARCGEDFDPKYAPLLATAVVQQMHAVKQSTLAEVEGNGRLLRVLVALGTRWVEPSPDPEEPKVLAVIEAEFVAEYRLQGELPQNCIEEFALKNASYHVWPYWREYLASQCERMRLPRLIMPAVQLAHHRNGNVDPAAE